MSSKSEPVSPLNKCSGLSNARFSADMDYADQQKYADQVALTAARLGLGAHWLHAKLQALNSRSIRV